MTMKGPRIYLGGKQGIELHRVLRNQGIRNNPFILIMGCLTFRSLKYSRYTQGVNILSMTWYTLETYLRENTRGSVLRIEGQAVSRVQVQKGVSGFQS